MQNFAYDWVDAIFSSPVEQNNIYDSRPQHYRIDAEQGGIPPFSPFRRY